MSLHSQGLSFQRCWAPTAPTDCQLELLVLSFSRRGGMGDGGSGGRIKTQKHQAHFVYIGDNKIIILFTAKGYLISTA